jgi:hypothetical protein
MKGGPSFCIVYRLILMTLMGRTELQLFHEITQLPCSVTSRVLGAKKESHRFKDRGCDNVLRGQGCRTSIAAVINKYGGTVER